MSPVDVLSVGEAAQIFLRWETEGPGEEERDEFIAKSLAVLGDPVHVQDLVDDIAQTAKLAAEIDKTFVDINKICVALVVFIWPIGIPLLAEWVAFTQRWRGCLRTSVQMAVTTSDALKRFDEIYLHKIENIVTEADRLSAMAALQTFKNELDQNDQADTMSRQFLDLKRDIAEFCNRFNSSALQTAVDPLLKDIETLDAQIKTAYGKLSGANSGMALALGMGADASSVVASLKSQRQEKAGNLRDIRKAMRAMEDLVTPSDYGIQREQITPPDLGLLLTRLGLFAELWSTIRSQTVQFSEHLAGGLAAATSARFKSEVKLARKQCQPLQAGLLEYKRELESWLQQ